MFVLYLHNGSLVPYKLGRVPLRVLEEACEFYFLILGAKTAHFLLGMIFTDGSVIFLLGK